MRNIKKQVLSIVLVRQPILTHIGWQAGFPACHPLIYGSDKERV